MTPTGFRRMALGLDAVTEQAHHGHPDFRVAGRIFATLGYPGPEWGALMLTPDQQESWLRKHPDAFVPVKGKWGEQGSTNVRLAVDEEALGSALTMAWQNAVAKTRGRSSSPTRRKASQAKPGQPKRASAAGRRAGGAGRTR